MNVIYLLPWFSNLGRQIFLDCKSQKSWPAQQVVKASGNFSPRTSGDPRLGSMVLNHKKIFSCFSSELLLSSVLLVTGQDLLGLYLRFVSNAVANCT